MALAFDRGRYSRLVARLMDNRYPYLCFLQCLLCCLCVAGLPSCNRQPPGEPVLLSSSTHSELGVGRSVSIEFQMGERPALIEIRSQDANCSSRVITPAGELSSKVHLAYLRSAPVYHYIDASAPPGRYTLEINPLQLTRLASVTVNLYALPADSRADKALASAWGELARGLQYVDTESSKGWAKNLLALSAAEKLFKSLGADEPALWAKYFRAYFEYYPLYRYSEALTAASSLIRKSADSNLPALTMLAHQLAGQIRLERDAGNDEAHARLNYQQAQENFTAARQWAERLNNSFEIIWAINNSGIAFNYQDRMDLSLQRYEEAMNRAMELNDAYLTTLIGTNRAVALQRLGHIDEAIETLQRLQQNLTAKSNPLEMKNVLGELGVYYLKLYQFPRALEALNAALELSIAQEDAESRGRNRHLLARAYREMGQLDKSLTELELAIPDLETAHDGRGLKLALALRADINRVQGKFEAMAGDRARQEQYLATDSDRAGWLASKARDAEAESNLEQAIRLNRESARIYAATAFPQLGLLAQLRACSLESRRKRETACSTENLQEGYDRIQSLQASIPALEGKYLWARLLTAEGQFKAARTVMTDLVDAVLFFRKSLPGVLGAWYLDARKDIFDSYMRLLLNADEDRNDIALDSLVELNRLTNRYLDRAPMKPAVSAPDHVDAHSNDFRVLLAQREQATTLQAREAVQRRIDLWLLAQHESSGEEADIDAAGLRQQLQKLPDDWSFLAYHFLDHHTYAWVGNAQGLSLHELGSAPSIRKLVADANAGIRTFNHLSTPEEMTRLGNVLIVPIEKELRFNVLFIGTGELSDFPLEAVVIGGEPMIRKHRVVNVMSAADPNRVAEGLSHSFTPHRLFLAGSPATQSPGVPLLAGASRELTAIRQRFQGEDITLVQGPDLTAQSLNSEAFGSADLIHLASHATIDREYPELSRIFVSPGEENPLGFITPEDLNNRTISARLVVLSACSTVGLNRFEYDSNLGFVSKFLQLGGRHVMASLWPIPDQATAAFLANYYAELTAGQDTASALRATKLKLIDAGQSGVNQWASFQLFSR